MKIQCDVCDKEEASVFCPADEAVLCHSCDHSIHHANKLAGKHKRFSLLQPTFKEAPLCDICQERRAFLFCQEDRAILCRECDIPIHKANEHTQKHNRFLLTGVKLSASSSLYQTSSSSIGNEVKSSHSSAKRPKSDSNQNFSSPSNVNSLASDNLFSETGSVSTSSISQYLIETLPGWCVEDILDGPSFAPHGFCKNYDNQSPFEDQDLKKSMSLCQSEEMVTWVPQFQSHSSELKETLKTQAMEDSYGWRDDNYTVPQISPPSLKRCRHFQ
ncbi:Zinc finger, B-box [Quillaja saponaria]|uniref:Zinc finger, B-box n=1 Tax=Quillaja saponaria TaxID=32244 RepID=A0AAD7QBK3_QUISA|nr:Zinc finger, B-box [Quillaja saponaria]